MKAFVGGAAAGGGGAFAFAGGGGVTACLMTIYDLPIRPCVATRPKIAGLLEAGLFYPIGMRSVFCRRSVSPVVFCKKKKKR